MMHRLSILFLVLVSTAALAEPNRGFYVAGGLMNQQMTARLQSTEAFDGSPVSMNTSGPSQYSTGATLLAGYQLPLTENGAVMIEAGIDMASRSLFKAHASSGGESLDVQWKVLPSWFVAVKPGLQLSDGVVIYLSLAYHLADADLSRTTLGTQNNTRTAVRTIGGSGIGMGLQGHINKSVFIRGEVESLHFSGASVDFIPGGSSGNLVSLHSIKPESIVGRVIVGYRF